MLIPRVWSNDPEKSRVTTMVSSSKHSRTIHCRISLRLIQEKGFAPSACMPRTTEPLPVTQDVVQRPLKRNPRRQSLDPVAVLPECGASRMLCISPSA